LISDAYFEQFQNPKYRRGNPLQRLLIRRFVGKVESLFVEAAPAETVLEVGVGEGFLAGHLWERFSDKKFTGVDLLQESLDQLKRLFDGIETHQGNVYDLVFLGREYDLVICAEVLEHLEDPQKALDQILSLKPKHTILTVPHEPWFMLSNFLRGKNLSRFGNDAEHVNHYTVRSFRNLLQSRFEILRLTTSYPWILALAKPR
jgi:SAM-dependent methyltransferase